MAEFPVGIDRDNLRLVPINKNGTISEMIETIDENFKNIAAHGGGPDGAPGMDGINGADGTSAEYIFALCDEELVEGTHYPATDQGDLFDSVEFAGSTSFPSSTNKKIEWFDHPQGVSKEHKNEYVFSRYKRTSGENIWFYAEKPELWAHWGETGKDGDGVEYIFMRSKTKLDESALEDIIIKKKSMSGDKYQSVIYQMDGFFPGEEWFTDKNEENAWKVIKAKYGEDSSYSEFDTLWKNNRFNMIVPGYNWTDEPKGTDPIYVYEYVAIRRCNVDDEDRKEWGDFSTPAIWSHYGLSTRTIIIYCNTGDTDSPVSPKSGEGIWNESEGKLTLPNSLVEAGWKDTNETPSENQITWMCSGIFDNSGKNVSWSKPMRITGKDGKQGEDGTTVEFIYTLSKNMPAHPTIEKETTDSNPGVINTKEELFDAAKNANAEYNSQVWYDRAQPISPDNPTEYVWSRRRDKESEPWEYEDEPIIWAHWGEDGTDGDGVEYIFYITNTETFDSANNPPKVSAITGTTELDKCKKLVYNMDDFYPNEDWFKKNELKIKKEITDAGYNVSNYDSVKAFFSKGWSDNPIKVSPMSPYQWVSIRRSHTDETTGGKRFWEDFSTPVLWNSYGKRTRSFIVYCNMSDETTPESPVGGWWNTSNNTLQMSKTNEKEYKSNALSSGTPNYTSNVGYWSDKNIDVSKTITWISTGEFSDSIDKEGSNNISWSAPFRITGHNGENGADGSNIEYIYALCDDEASLKYPKKGPSMSDADYMDALNRFFNDVNASDNEGYWPSTNPPQEDATKWTDNPQGVSNENGKRIEWVWSRSKPAGKTTQWEYAPKPVKWSHWGEDGTDGDGVEYIFYATNDKNFSTPPIQQSAIDTSTTNGKYQKALFQVNDFYPGTGFFKKGDGNKKRDRVKNEISSKVDGFSETYFNDQWDSANPFGLASNWTDNPTGTGSTSQYEFVSIRRFTTEDVSGKKTWGEFGEPKLWSSFSIRTRVFVVYCNIPRDITAQVQTPTGGYWNVTEDKLQNDQNGGTYSCNALTGSDMPSQIPSGTCVWSDTDQDVSNTITWMATGIFYEDNTAPKWSEPHRITGEDGQRGTDGSNMEFIYAISESMVAGTNYPTTDKDDANPTNTDTKEWLFDHVENDDTFDPENGDPKGYAYKNTFWYDRAQPIENVAGKRTEYAWSRYRSAGTTEWTYDPKPFVWAHWGEDGTDGDGVEYIFMLRNTPLDNKYKTDWDNTWTDGMALLNNDNGKAIIKAIYSIDDFIPDSKWLYDNHNTIDTRARQILAANGIPVSDNYSQLLTHAKKLFSFNDEIQNVRESLGKWYDNPQELTPSNKYQYVSIRKMNDGEWGDFTYPKLWGKYNISSFTEFAFTATIPDVDLSNYIPTGGNFLSPKPVYNSETEEDNYKNLDLVWSDGPKPVLSEGKTIIWMTSAKFKEDDTNSPTWSVCQRMADTSTFQVEWSSQELSDNDLNDAKTAISSSDYNFGKFLTEAGYNADTAESNWRKFVLDNLTINFSDTSGNAVLMATCQEKNGKWSNWKLDRVKGEKGDDGKPGADGSNIQFIYARQDTKPSYPSISNKNDLDEFFNDINTNRHSYWPKDGDQKTYWTDNPQGIEDAEGKRKEWVWSRSLPAGLKDIPINWVYPDKPVIWSHWGEDGTDGDGVEYIFFLSQNRFSMPEDTWKSYWSFLDSKETTDIILIQKVVYSMDDFYPNTSWFNDDNKREVYNKVAKQNIILSKKFDEIWTDHVGKDKDYFGFNLGWTDNPQDLTPSNKYQYVSIRKTKNDPEDPKGKEWGAFSYPKLWSKYNTSTLKVFAFTSTTLHEDISDYKPTGLVEKNNIPSGCTYNDKSVTVTWYDSPQPTDTKPLVWMTSATITEKADGTGYELQTSWSAPQKMTDTAEFQVEWATNDIIGDGLTSKITMLKNNKYNFGYFLNAIIKADDNLTNEDIENRAEEAWRYVVKHGYKPKNDFNSSTPYLNKDSFDYEIDPVGLDFADNSSNAILMATCQLSNGIWSNWKLDRVKGEQGPQGEPGTSIKVKGKIAYEVFLEDGINYEYSSAETAKDNANIQQPQEDRLLIVYPHSANSDGIYEGDVAAGDALYMWKYVNGQWDDYNCKPDAETNSNGEDIGNTYESPNKHLILWDGDSWMDLGELQGPAGPAGKEWRVLTRYANDDFNSTNKCKKRFVEKDADIPSAKYVGFLTYEHKEEVNPKSYDEDNYTWSLFKGQDGNGYEYIFWASDKNVAPPVPTTSDEQDSQNDVKPNVNINGVDYKWSDDPIEPTKTQKYVWMCWRKYNKSSGKWDKFRGKDGKLSTDENAVARLWQVYANSINEVKEYFHADTSMSPNNINTPVTDINYWFTDKSNCGWNANTKYLFNVEVITFLDGKTQTLDPHLIAVWETGLIDVIDYYILESANSSGNGDPGDNAPHINTDEDGIITPETSSEIENPVAGKDYWTTSVPKMDKDYPVLWNISKKEYDGGKKEQWTTPIVIGVYGQGANGENSIYADLDNEMDSIQIDEKNTILVKGTYNTTVRLYCGSTMMRINDIDISGEEAIMKNGYTLTYYYDDGTKKDDGSANLAYKGEIIFVRVYDPDKKIYKFTPKNGGTDPIGDVSHNINCIKITFTVTKNTTLKDVYSKVVISVGHNEGINETARRSVSYTFVGTTHPYVYSIVPKHSAIVFSSGKCTPSSLFVEVKRQVGTEKESFDTYASTQGFDLTYTITQGSTFTSSILNNGSFQVSTTTLKPGDYITFAVNVDNDGNTVNGKETTLDRETVYVLREGSDGPKGDAGNGYRYYYARYVASNSLLYGSYTIPTIASSTLSSDEPIFLLGSETLPASQNAKGAEESYPYEYRTEQFFNGSQWSNWSEPITIAKYLTAGNISTEVSKAVTNATKDINDRLTTATSTINKLSGYFDASGVLDSSRFPTGILSGYMSTANDVAGAINTIGIGGLTVDPSAGISLFGYLQNQSEGILTAVGTDYLTKDAAISTYATQVSLNDVASAMDTFKADAHDKFAQMDRTVANAQFMTDEEGYLMVDIPDYSIWFNTTTELSGPYKDTDIRNDVTWVLASISEGSDGSDSDSEIDPDTIHTSNTLVPYIIPENKLYNTNTDTVVFVLKTVITNFNIISQLTDIKNIIDREIIVTLNKLTGKYTIYVDSGSESESESDISILAGIYTYDEKIPELDSDKVLVIMYVTANVSDGKDGIFSDLKWTVGVAEGQIGVSAEQGGGINSFSYVNTASLFNEPMIPFYGTKPEEKLERIQYMTSLNQEYGYGVTNSSWGTNGDDYNEYGELTTNGKLSITGYYGYNYMLIPENESVENIIKFLKGSELKTAIPNDDEIGIGESKTYYVAANKGNSVSKDSDNTYTISLPGNNKVEFIMDKEYAKPMFENKHIFNEVESKGFTVTDDGFRQTTTKEGSYDYYDMYITSKYDEVKISYEYNITPGEPSTDTDFPINSTYLYLLYWYEGEPEPTEPSFDNSKVIFEAYTIIDPGDPEANNNTYGKVDDIPIFKNIELQEDKLLHMKVYTECGADLKDVNIKYKLETSNRITYGNAFEDEKISISNITEKDTTNTEESYTPQHLIILTSATSGESNKCSYIFKYRKSTISVTTVTSYIKDIYLRLKLECSDNIDGGFLGGFYYMAIPGSYDAKTLQSLSKEFDNSTDTDYLLNGGFLDNEEFNTVGIKEWNEVEPTSSFTPIDLEFNKVEADSDKSGFSTYSYTIIQYYPYNGGEPNFKSTMTADVISEMPWYTKNGYSRSPYGSNPKYLIDKIKVTVNDRSRIGELLTKLTKKVKAHDKYNSNDPGVKNYIEVLDADKPYLTTNVSELATISQMVSDGIACTSIITKAGGKQAVFLEQASKDGSKIYMNADEVGIESKYFHLNNDGLTLTGNLYAKDKNKHITAGVIGDSSSIGDGVKFFAGINLPSTYSDSEIKNAVQKAKFYVTESGFLYAENAKISGNITANNFSASETYERDINQIGDDGLPVTNHYLIKKASIMNESQFEVTSVASLIDDNGSEPLTNTAKIYITVLDKISVDNGDISVKEGAELINVPTLCMEYNGNKYYLTPDMWKYWDPESTPTPIEYKDIYLFSLGGIHTIYYERSDDYTNVPICAGWMVWIEYKDPQNPSEIITQTLAYVSLKETTYTQPIKYGTQIDIYWGEFSKVSVKPEFCGKMVTIYYSIITNLTEINRGVIISNYYIPYRSDKENPPIDITGLLPYTTEHITNASPI